MLLKKLFPNVCFIFMFILISGCVPLWIMNQPEQPQLPRPLDIPNIFYSDRLVSGSVRYFNNKVLFIADIGTSPNFTNLEAFMADKDGRTNLQRLTFGTGNNNPYFITYARLIQLVFNDSKILVEFNKMYRASNPLAPITEMSGCPFYIFDLNGNKIFEKNVQCVCVNEDDKNTIAFVAENESGIQSKPPLGLYTMGDDLQSRKICDLPTQINLGVSENECMEYLRGNGLCVTISKEFPYDMIWKDGEIKFTTLEYKNNVWSGFDVITRIYKVNPDGSDLKLLETKRIKR